MPSVERRQATEEQFAEVVLEQIRRAGSRRISDEEFLARTGGDGQVELDVAVPFRVRVRMPAESDSDADRKRPEPCCVCLEQDGRITCLGSCCSG